jgi:hypothetical protein
MNSRSKGKRGELEFIRDHLAEFWPEAKRNLDQFKGDGRDCLEAGDFHWQIKRTESLRLWDAIEQAESEAVHPHVPLVAFRRNRSKWYVIAPAEFVVPVLAEVDHAA